MRVYFLFQYEKAARFLNFDKGFIFYFNIRMLLDFLTLKKDLFVFTYQMIWNINSQQFHQYQQYKETHFILNYLDIKDVKKCVICI
jgi:hypothetical protein